MFQRTNILTAAIFGVLAIAPLSSAWEKQIEHQGVNVTLTHGQVQNNEHLAKRAVPSECSFQGTRGDFSYLQITGLAEGTACVGWDNFETCGTGSWEDPDWTDLQTAMSEQVTKDGWLETSSSGDWDASFFLGTTAFSDPDSSLFILGLLESDIKSLIYYYSRDGDFATVIGRDGSGCT